MSPSSASAGLTPHACAASPTDQGALCLFFGGASQFGRRFGERVKERVAETIGAVSDPAKTRPHFRVLTQHLALLGSSLGLLVVAKVLASAWGRPETALAVARHSGIPEVTLGSLIQVYPYLLAGTAMYLALVADSSTLDEERRLARALFIPVAVITIPLSPLWAAGYVWIAGDFVFQRWPGPGSLFSWRWDRGRKKARSKAADIEAELDSAVQELDALDDDRRPSGDADDAGAARRRELRDRVVRRAKELGALAEEELAQIDPRLERMEEARRRTPRTIGVLVAFLGAWALAQLLLQPPWLPPERLTLNSGASVVGYVLVVEGDQIVLLRDKQRQVERLAAPDIESRNICSLDDPLPRWVDGGLLELLMSPPAYPPCR